MEGKRRLPAGPLPEGDTKRRKTTRDDTYPQQINDGPRSAGPSMRRPCARRLYSIAEDPMDIDAGDHEASSGDGVADGGDTVDSDSGVDLLADDHPQLSAEEIFAAHFVATAVAKATEMAAAAVEAAQGAAAAAADVEDVSMEVDFPWDAVDDGGMTDGR